jgi:hypothetical protein
MMGKRIRDIAKATNLNDEASMYDAMIAICGIVVGGPNAELEMWLSCVDLEDPSQMYDALVHLAK